MFKLILSALLVISVISDADDNGSVVECKARCWGADKAAEGIIRAIDEVLNQKETKTGAYQKKYEELSEKIKTTERNMAALRLLETDPISSLPKFATMLIKKNIAKKTNMDMCFHRCGSARLRANQSIDFMHEYFMTVVLSMDMDSLKKVFLYYGTPFYDYDAQKTLDKVAKEMKQGKFDEVLKKSKDDQVVEFMKNVRAGKASFSKIRPEEK